MFRNKHALFEINLNQGKRPVRPDVTLIARERRQRCAHQMQVTQRRDVCAFAGSPSGDEKKWAAMVWRCLRSRKRRLR